MFYIQPPRGVLALNTLTSCVETRIKYLELIYNKNNVDSFEGNIEYLFEGSKYDRTGHFILRLLSSTSNDLWSYWLIRERKLLGYRLSNVSKRQIYRMLRSIKKSVENFEDKNELYAALYKVSTFFLQCDIFNHIIAEDHPVCCEAYNIRLKFQIIPDLISKRLVDLENGFVIISCSKWKELLISLFMTLLAREKINLNNSCIANVIKADPRLNFIYQRVEMQLKKSGQIGKGRITNENIDSEVYNFPPCMSHLHFTLRRRHRLSHNARFYYSLFLKECGMDIEDALEFWKKEYSQSHTCVSSCSHNWQSDNRRFTYSIRHLYGLEGSRKNYNAPNCSAMCNNACGPRYEGGCPFKNFDKDNLEELLARIMKQGDSQKYLETFLSQKPEIACAFFLKLKHVRNIDNIFVNSPTHYYHLMKEHN